MKIVILVTLFCLSNGFNPVLYKLKNPILAGTSLAIGKKYISTLSKSNINTNLTRKIIHITCAPAFISTWTLYNDFFTRYWAALVPFISSFYLIYKRNNLKDSISRSGKSNELLKGPLIYTLILTYLTYKYWLFNEIGIISMLQLSIGDGFADIIGRKYGKHKWFFNKKKSIEGTIGFCFTSFFGCLLFFKIFHNYSINIFKLFIISLSCSIVELIPFVDDNISVPLFTILFYNFQFLLWYILSFFFYF